MLNWYKEYISELSLLWTDNCSITKLHICFSMYYQDNVIYWRKEGSLQVTIAFNSSFCKNDNIQSHNRSTWTFQGILGVRPTPCTWPGYRWRCLAFWIFSAWHFSTSLLEWKIFKKRWHIIEFFSLQLHSVIFMSISFDAKYKMSVRAVCCIIHIRLNCIFLLQAELTKMKQLAQETKQFIDNQEAEERKLLKIIADADAKRVRQKKELDQVEEWVSTSLS